MLEIYENIDFSFISHVKLRVYIYVVRVYVQT